MTDRNDMGFWFPPLEAAGLPVPRTKLVRCHGDLTSVLDGAGPGCFHDLVSDLKAAAQHFRYPCFLRTGHGSGKHSWDQCCFVQRESVIAARVCNLVEWSHLVDLMGLPTTTWAVRELLDTDPICRCRAYGGFPVVREFRFFVRTGVVEHVQPYWPISSVAKGHPDVDGPVWRTRLAAASSLGHGEREHLGTLASAAAWAVDTGHWSVDMLQDRHGKWWVTDMADGDMSYKYDVTTGEEIPA